MEVINTSKFLVCHLNAQSIDPHFSDISAILCDKRPHVLGVSESWLKPSMAPNLYDVPDYRLVRADRVGAGGGGVAIYIHDSVEFSIVDQSQHPDIFDWRPEFLLILVRVGNLKILIAVVYCSPKATSKDEFWSSIEDAISSYHKPYDYTILMGDLNINWDVPSFLRSTLKHSFEAFDLTRIPFVEIATRKSTTYASAILVEYFRIIKFTCPASHYTTSSSPHLTSRYKL